MKVCAVVSEFNPFHNGHKYLLSCIRDMGYDTIVCVMSGNFVQRAEYSVLDKRVRASDAVDNGADLVLSLPFPWSSASAELFARGAVSIICSLGCVDALAFGSESGDIGSLMKYAQILSLADNNAIKEIQKNDPRLSFAQARQQYVSMLLGSSGYNTILEKPNDILAVEYIKALLKFGSTITPVAVKRICADHGKSEHSDRICSSSYIRELLNDNRTAEISEFVPWHIDNISESVKKIDEKAYFNFLRGAVLSRSPDELSQFAENGGGFEFALYREMLLAKDLSDLTDRIHSRHLTDSKIRRALLFTSLGVRKEVFTSLPGYTEVLALSEKGQNLLSRCRKDAKINILSKTANIKKADEHIKEQFKLQRIAELSFETLLKNERGKT